MNTHKMIKFIDKNHTIYFFILFFKIIFIYDNLISEEKNQYFFLILINIYTKWEFYFIIN
jgi:hypothetical protein